VAPSDQGRQSHWGERGGPCAPVQGSYLEIMSVGSGLTSWGLVNSARFWCCKLPGSMVNEISPAMNRTNSRWSLKTWYFASAAGPIRDTGVAGFTWASDSTPGVGQHLDKRTAPSQHKDSS